VPDRKTIVMVGGGLAGAKAAETLREEGFDGRVVLVADEARSPYERPPLSKGYLERAHGSWSSARAGSAARSRRPHASSAPK
jgi:NADPH-dependent 2,4-dienoyl-CoA reductase/sulfur reductase-like enzyme